MNPIAQLYERHLLPHITHYACSGGSIGRQRQKVVPLAEGRVLEVGVGSGLNLPHYTADKVQHLFALDPGVQTRARRAADALAFPVEFLQLEAEQIPLEDHSVDAIVMTYTLCTIPDSQAALGEMRRVLKPGGRLYFSEHARSPHVRVARWQARINPVWRMFGGGCHLNRDITGLIETGGFAFEALESMDLPGLSIAGHHVWGQARVR
jgi:ubiquinone/menaquinone biosynthesis C-methylase UbiE